jgi:GNAT superfamily N-acetyltransferase
MLDLPATITLTQCATGSTMQAAIVPLTGDLAQRRIGARWWAGLGASAAQRGAEPDHHWDWTKLVGYYRNDPFVECLAVQTPDEDIQGAMIYHVNGRSVLEPGAGSVIGDRLATAPRNRSWLVAAPAYQGAGTGLLLRSVAHSYKLGLKGRMNLFALPIPRTTEFYEGLDFVPTDVEQDDTILYELPADRAIAWLRRTGILQ